MRTLSKTVPDHPSEPQPTLPPGQVPEMPEGNGAIPLSFAQERLWFHDQLEPNSALYNVPTVVRLKGKLNEAALQDALDGLVARHEILRTRFVSAEGAPSQVIDKGPGTRMHVVDLRDLPPAVREERGRALVREEVNRAFDLSSLPPVRAMLLRLGADEHWLVLNLHHIVSDEWSLKFVFAS